MSSPICEQNNEARMWELERMINEQMLKQYRCNRSRLWVGHSLIIRYLSFVIILALTGAASIAGQKRNITEKDLFDFVWIGDPQVSPDGSTVAFVKVIVNDKKDGYNTSIWSVSTANGEMHQLTSGIRDTSPRWSPDGKYLAFVRVTERDGHPDLPQLFMLSMSGGDSFQFTSVPRGAGQPVWSPDGRTIAFSNSANADELARQGKPPASDARESDVRVISRAVYRF